MQPKTNTVVDLPLQPLQKEKTPLEAAMDEVRADAETKPDAYARETIVPEGGE